MSEKVIPSWSLKGPIPIFRNEIEKTGYGSSGSSLPSSFLGKSSTTPKSQVSVVRSGTAILELRFQYPCQIRQITFRNYYTAWISIFVKRLDTANNSRLDLSSIMKEDIEKSCSEKYDLCRSHLDLFNGFPGAPMSSLLVSKNLKSQDEQDEDDSRMIGVLDQRDTDGIVQKHTLNFTAQNENEIQGLPWEVLIESKMLMPWPHHEGGSQDHVSIKAAESLVRHDHRWKDVILLRVILNQPSTVWKTFSIDDVIVYSHLTQNKRMSHFETQKNHSLSVLKASTKGMLSGQIVEPENNGSEDDELKN